jgi:2-methylisocitrate lyase-like PEP mutase family enzyme
MPEKDSPASAAAFLAMHHDGRGFILPNVWDPGSARILEHVGFPVLATTSAGISFANGRPDGTLTRSAMLSAVAAIVDAVACPVSADLEAGYGATVDDVAATVTDAVAIGVVGANIEDRDPATGELFDRREATERIAAARSAAPVGQLVLNARVDSFLLAPSTRHAAAVFDDAVERAADYVDAGADCIFVPGVEDEDVVAELVNAIHAPLNVVAGLTERVIDAPTLRSLGVARISVGGSLARATLAFIERAGRDLLERGSFDHVHGAISHGDLQRRFASST